MKAKYIFKGLLVMFLLIVAACESYNEPVLEDIGASRAFSPIELKAIVRNQTSVELNWTVKSDVDHYVVEFSADDTEFKTIYKRVNVAPKELPVTIPLEGETIYSIRVKGVSATGAGDSKWSITSAKTLTEQILSPIEDIDIEAKQVTLRWIPNSTVTQITIAPGNITHTITPAEKTAGVAVVTGLTGETDYTATLLNGTKTRGVRSFKTGIDIGTGILVKETDDLNAVIAAADAKATLVLMPGNYQVFKGEIILTKPITIRGLRAGDKPKLHVRFSLNSGATAVSLIDLDLNGDGTLSDAVKYNEVSTGFDALLISGCTIHDFTKALVAQSLTGITKVVSVTIENSVVTNVLTNQGDFIDFRTAHLGSLVLKNSTFSNCATARDFIRIDAAANLSGTGLETNILIDGCTISNKAMLASNRILYVRFVKNTSTVKNSIFETGPALYANQAGTAQPTFLNNNYFNSTALHTAGAAAVKYDSSGSFTTLDPKFTNSAQGDFTIGNQTLKDNNVGDPHWIK